MDSHQRARAKGEDKGVLILIAMTVVHICEHTKSHRTINFKGVNYVVCELYLNKVARPYAQPKST